MAIALAEADKYEILDKIGMFTVKQMSLILIWYNTNCFILGCGSFGIIRKVKRKTDGFVSLIVWSHCLSSH